jgi:hypothetical protein
MYQCVVANYANNKLCYLSDPPLSRISVFQYADYKAMNAKAVQNVTRDQHIVITEYPIELIVPTDTVKFDEAGLQLLKNLEVPIDLTLLAMLQKHWQSFSVHIPVQINTLLLLSLIFHPETSCSLALSVHWQHQERLL